MINVQKQRWKKENRWDIFKKELLQQTESKVVEIKTTAEQKIIIKPKQQVKPEGVEQIPERKLKRLAGLLIILFAIVITGYMVISYLPLPPLQQIWIDAKPYFNNEFFLFVLTGFLAQMVDGVLSMGYGVTSATCLISFGVNPVAMSAAIHTSEIFTTGISGYSHYKFGNVNKKMFRHLLVPGVMLSLIHI